MTSLEHDCVFEEINNKFHCQRFYILTVLNVLPLELVTLHYDFIRPLV